jgi:hypothetical protein
MKEILHLIKKLLHCIKEVNMYFCYFYHLFVLLLFICFD